MQQVWHIFKKDFRYLWREVCLVAVLAAIFAWRDPWWVEMLLSVAASYLVVRLIHAEPIPGDNQFWITRPYRWKSLLGAKVLFILAFVDLPVLVAQWLILVANRYPLASSLPGLLWSQVLLILGVCFPIAALAAVTSSTTTVMVSTLVLATIAFSLHGALIPLDRQWPAGVEWVRDSTVVSGLLAMALAILYLQYRNRWTRFSRI